MPRGVGQPRRRAQQLFPFVARQTLIIPVGARMFAAMVEKADIVVRHLQRLDLGRDESVEFVQIGLQIGRNRKIHRLSPLFFIAAPFGARRRERGIFRAIDRAFVEHRAAQLCEQTGLRERRGAR